MGYYSSGRIPRARHSNYISVPLQQRYGNIRKVNNYRNMFIKHNKGVFGFYMCRRCHRIINIYELEVDHIIPKSKGGSDDLYNLQPMCRRCNRSKSANTSDTIPDLIINLIYNFTVKTIKNILGAIR